MTDPESPMADQSQAAAPLSELQDRMIAALYGELDDDEQRELEAAIQRDEAAQRQWQELREMRACLRSLDQVVPAAGFSFNLPGEADSPPATQAPATSGATVVPLWHWMLPAAAGFAAAVILFLALLLAGIRVDRTPGGLLVRFEPEPAPRGKAVLTDSVTGERVADGRAGARYVTRDELASFARLLTLETAARLDQLERRQLGSQTEVAQTLYDALAISQQRQYADLRARIELAAYHSGGPAYSRRQPPGLLPGLLSQQDSRDLGDQGGQHEPDKR